MAIQSFVLVETKPMPIYETENGVKYTNLREIIFALFGDNHIKTWLDTLEYTYAIIPISFKYHKKDKEKEFLIKLDDLYAFERVQPNNILLRQLKAINNMTYKKPELMLVQDFCKYMNENYNLNCKRNNMFKFLRDNGFLDKIDIENVPTQKAIDLDLFQVVSNIMEYKNNEQSQYINFNTPYITEKGKNFLTKFVLDSKEFE